MICIFNGSKEKTNADICFDRDDVFSAGKILGSSEKLNSTSER